MSKSLDERAGEARKAGEQVPGQVANAAHAEILAAERTKARRHKLFVISARAGIIVVGLALWELVSGRLFREFWISKPSLVFDRLVTWASSDVLARNLFATLQEAILGFLIGATVGLFVGVLLGRAKALAEVTHPFIVALNSLPKLALAPLFILWLGIGLTMKVVLAATIVFFLVFSSTYSGVRSVEQNLIDVARTMGARRNHILRKIVIPSALLWVFSGLRVSIPYSLIGAVVGEIFASNLGIGYLIQRASSQFDTAGVFAGLVILTVVATALNWILSRVENFVLRWQM